MTMTTDQAIISRFSHRPYEADAGMILIAQHPRPSLITRNAASSIGLLETLPIELMHHILNELDFQSISRFSRVSLRTNDIVQSLQAYRDLMEHAPQALKALGQTRLIVYHSANTIHAALRSQKCVSCAEYGAYLFLPTCERCCWGCLHDNQSLWVISRETAAKCFSLSSCQLDQLPNMLSIPGEYFVGHRISRKRRLKLVCLKAAKQLALRIHGSWAEVTRRAFQSRRISDSKKYEYRHFQDAPLEPLAHDPLTQPDQGRDMDDPFSGMASICFPSLLHNSVENGLWCRGCDWTFKSYESRRLTSSVVSQLVPNNLEPWRVLMGMRRRGRSRADFLEHIKHCFGVQILANELDTERWTDTAGGLD